MGLFNKLFGNSSDDEDDSFLMEATPRRALLKEQIKGKLLEYGFSRMEIQEVMDVITLAEADIKIEEDSLAHVNYNETDPTRAMHAALQNIRQYEKELAYNIRKKIIDIMQRKQNMGG